MSATLMLNILDANPFFEEKKSADSAENSERRSIVATALNQNPARFMTSAIATPALQRAA